MSTRTKPPLVEVTWRDAYVRSSAATIDATAKEEDHAIQLSVGWLVLNNDRKIVLALTYQHPEAGEPADAGEYNDRLTIPQAYVDKVRFVERGPRRKKEAPSA